MDSRIGTGQITGVEDFCVKTDTPFQLQGYRYYHGARLVNAERSVEYKILEVRSANGAIIDPETHPHAKADKLAKEFANGTWFDVYDYGVGDEIVWPYAVSVELIGNSTYRVAAPVSITLNLPKGSTVRPGRLVNN